MKSIDPANIVGLREWVDLPQLGMSLISFHISCIFVIDQISYPCKPQRILSKYLLSGINS